MSNEQRIEQLERRCRWLAVALAGFAAVAGLVMFGGAAPLDVGKKLRVESLEIVDDAGMVRVRMGNLDQSDEPHAKGMYGLLIRDTNGELSVRLDDRAMLVLEKRGLHKEAGGKVSLSATELGAILHLDGTERQVAELMAWDDQSVVRLVDNAGNETWKQTTPRTESERAKAFNPFR